MHNVGVYHEIHTIVILPGRDVLFIDRQCLFDGFFIGLSGDIVLALVVPAFLVIIPFYIDLNIQKPHFDILSVCSRSLRGGIWICGIV